MEAVKSLVLLDDLSQITPNMVEAAIAVTAGRMRVDSPTTALELLRSGDPNALAYFRFELARQVAEVLLRLDYQVIAVYEEQEAPESDELAPEPPGLSDPIRLCIRVRRDVAASRALLAALSRNLGELIEVRLGHRPWKTIEATIIEATGERRPNSRWFHRPPPILLAERTNG